MKRKIIVALLLIAVLGTVLLLIKHYLSDEQYSAVPKRIASMPEAYAGSASCKECHPKAFADWQASDHFKAMQRPTTETVLGDFDNASYTADGITSHFFKRGDKYYVNTQGADGKYADFEVSYTFGYYPLQQYLVAFQGGKMQVLRQSWDSRKGKWFHQYAGQKIAPDDYFHWTNASQNWNLMCASCHSTNLHKNYNPLHDTYTTDYSELTVGCESCHGAGKKHIAWVKDAAYKKGSKELFISLQEAHSQKQQLNTCGACHARRGETTQYHTPSSEFLDNYIPEIPAVAIYYPDGQAFDEVYKYTSFLQSKMFHAGVRCTDCHRPHTGKVKIEGNGLCLQCHSQTYASTQHTFHKEGTAASDCRHCHMPTRTYMGNDVRHDHNFKVPRPDLSEKYAVPNACNDCHTGKSARWTAEAVKKWYGNVRKPHFAEDLILGSRRDKQSYAHLAKLLSDPATPAIIKATATHYLGGLHTPESFRTIVTQLTSTDPQTRYRAVIALGNFSIQGEEAKVLPLLSEPVRAVRLAATNLWLTQKGRAGVEALPQGRERLTEYETFVLSQSDFPVGAATAGDYYTQMGAPQKAILFYERALTKDPSLNYLRLNLAILYSQLQQKAKAWQCLDAAEKRAPSNPQIAYYKALLLTEEKNYTAAKKAYEKALKLGMNTPQVQQNYQAVLRVLQEK